MMRMRPIPKLTQKASKLSRLLVNRPYRTALRRYGVAAAIEHRSLCFPQSYRTVLDVGANRGQFALFAATAFPDVELHCFEPLPNAYRDLTTVLANYPNVHTSPYAVGSVSGRRTFHVADDDDSSSLLRPTHTQTRVFPQTSTVSTITVAVASLDSLVDCSSIPQPCLLKLDVQGFELEVLKGAETLLEHGVDLLIEASFIELYASQPLVCDIAAFLAARDYALRDLHSLIRDSAGTALQADFFFCRRDAQSSEPL